MAQKTSFHRKINSRMFIVVNREGIIFENSIKN